MKKAITIIAIILTCVAFTALAGDGQKRTLQTRVADLESSVAALQAVAGLFHSRSTMGKSVGQVKLRLPLWLVEELGGGEFIFREPRSQTEQGPNEVVHILSSNGMLESFAATSFFPTSGLDHGSQYLARMTVPVVLAAWLIEAEESLIDAAILGAYDRFRRADSIGVAGADHYEAVGKHRLLISINKNRNSIVSSIRVSRQW